MAARRVLSVSLPPSDPATAAIEAWLTGLPAGADVASEARRLLALALDLRGPLARIEARLADLKSSNVGGFEPAAPAEDAESAEAMDRLFSFG